MTNSNGVLEEHSSQSKNQQQEHNEDKNLRNDSDTISGRMRK